MQFGYIPIEDEVPHAFPPPRTGFTNFGICLQRLGSGAGGPKTGKTEDYNELMARSLNYANVFDPDKGWVCGRFGDGTFTDEFDANGNMFYITEGTPKHYTWYVPHDVEGLMDLMGGKEPFSQKLNALIDNREYWHGNEPSHHIPYLFNYAGDWQKTQETVNTFCKLNTVPVRAVFRATTMPGKCRPGMFLVQPVFTRFAPEATNTSFLRQHLKK
jgi:hypothetical protein